MESKNLNLLLSGWPIKRVSTVDLGNSSTRGVDRPAPPLSTAISYSQIDGFIKTINHPTHIWYFTLAKGFSIEAISATWWKDCFEECLKKHSKVQLAYNLEYHADAVTLHAHGIVYDTDYKDLQKMKKDLRAAFKIHPTNRVAIKWYQNNNKDHTSTDKIKYHLASIDYNNCKKYNLIDEFHVFNKRSDAEAESCAATSSTSSRADGVSV